MFKRWLLVFIPTILISIVFIYVGGGIGLITAMGHGTDFTIPTILINLPLFLFYFAGYSFYKYSKKLIASYFWVPIYLIAYLLFFYGDYTVLVMILVLIILTALLVLIKNKKIKILR